MFYRLHIKKGEQDYYHSIRITLADSAQSIAYQFVQFIYGGGVEIVSLAPMLPAA